MADWKCWNMSVCIAGLASDGKDIAFVSDTKAAFGDFSADRAVSKGEPLTFGYVIQFAGNDVARAGNVIRRASQKLNETNPDRHRLPPDDVAECVYRECQAERRRAQEAKVLAKHGYTYDLFTHSGKEICTDSVFYDIHAELEATKLSLDFLIGGFDQNGDGHIRFTNSVTPPEDYDSLGFWAIGRGQHNALAYLSHAIEHLGLSKRDDPAEVLYHLFAAKFMAESATDVGDDTDAILVSAERKARILYIDGADYIKAQWKKHGAPRVPDKLFDPISLFLASKEDIGELEYLKKLAPYSKSARFMRDSLMRSASEKSTQGK
jgi:hypothetical protein